MEQGEDEGTGVLVIWIILLDKGCRSHRLGGQGAHERWELDDSVSVNSNEFGHNRRSCDLCASGRVSRATSRVYRVSILYSGP